MDGGSMEHPKTNAGPRVLGLLRRFMADWEVIRDNEVPFGPLEIDKAIVIMVAQNNK